MTLKKREFTPESGSVDTYALPRGQPENVVHSGMRRSRFKPRAGNNIFSSFLLFAINKAYF